jgi:hypothetical protein
MDLEDGRERLDHRGNHRLGKENIDLGQRPDSSGSYVEGERRIERHAFK